MSKKKGGEKILIIDDDPFIVDMYVLKFREQGFEVDVAHNGKEGLEKIAEFNPDAVLLDVVMPVLDGFGVLQELKRNLKGGQLPKIILLTNLGQKDDVERGLELGAFDYVIKAHFTPSEVVEKVREVLAK